MRRWIVGLAVLTVLVLCSPAHAVVFIDFEQRPDGTPTISGDPIADTYAEWGVTFREIGMGSSQPVFEAGYENPGRFAGTGQCGGYPPGFNIVADFSVPVLSVSTDVGTAKGKTITMVAKDATGGIIDSVTSVPNPNSFWVGNLEIVSAQPIALVEWWPSLTNAGVMVDNMAFAPIPEPSTLIIWSLLGALGIAVGWWRRRT